MAKKKPEQEEVKPKREPRQTNTVKVSLNKDIVRKAQDAATLLAPQFNMPAQAAIEGVIKFAYEQAQNLKVQVDKLRDAIAPPTVEDLDEPLDAVYAPSGVTYAPTTDEGNQLALDLEY